MTTEIRGLCSAGASRDALRSVSVSVAIAIAIAIAVAVTLAVHAVAVVALRRRVEVETRGEDRTADGRAERAEQVQLRAGAEKHAASDAGFGGRVFGIGGHDE